MEMKGLEPSEAILQGSLVPCTIPKIAQEPLRLLSLRRGFEPPLLPLKQACYHYTIGYSHLVLHGGGGWNRTSNNQLMRLVSRTNRLIPDTSGDGGI